ncbi:MAG: hypothetical protein KDJ88_20605, partial [Bauldia sp.]|nr:hypothetical protein [Bauldia sp.]
MADSRNDRKQALDKHRARADAFEKQGDWTNAVREREAAYAIASGQGNRVRLVDALTRAGETERSYRLLLEALDTGPVNGRAIRRGFQQAVELNDRERLPSFAASLKALLANPDEPKPKKRWMPIWHALVWLGEIDTALAHMEAPPAAEEAETGGPHAIVVDPAFAPDTGHGHNFNNNLFYWRVCRTLGLPVTFYGACDAGFPAPELGFNFRPAITTRMYTGELPFDDLQWHRNVNRYFEAELDRQMPASGRLFIFHTMRNTTILGLARWMQRNHRADGTSLIIGIVDSNLGAHPTRAGIAGAIYAEAFESLRQLENADLLVYCETQSQIDTLVELGGGAFDIQLYPYVAAALALDHALPHGANSGGPLQIGYLGGTRLERGADLVPGVIRATRRALGDRVAWTAQLDPAKLSRLVGGAIDEEVAAIRDDPAVELVEGMVPTEDYFAMLDRLDIVVLPYRERYEVSGSGVFVEATTLGKVLVVPERGWMAEFARKYGGEPVTFADLTAES